MKILFIGDSITDAGRDRSVPSGLGDGYVSLLAEKLRPLYEDKEFTFANRGVTHFQKFLKKFFIYDNICPVLYLIMTVWI